MRIQTLHRTAVVALLAGSLGLAGCSAGAPATDGDASAAPADLDHVKIQLDFQVRGLHSVFFVGKEMGFFEDAGIAVDSITPGKSSGETLQVVSSLTDTIGVADLPTLVLNRSKGVPVKAVAAINQYSPMAMCSLKDKLQLKSPQDLKGHSISVQAAGSTYLFTKSLLAVNDIPEDALTYLTVNPPYESYLLTGQVDVVPCYKDAELTILAEHAGGEDKLSVLDGAKWGYEAYGTGIFASDAFISEHPDTIAKFAKGFAKSLQYVIDNPEKAAEITAASSPELSGNVALYQAQIAADIADSFTSPTTDAHGLGAMSDEQWKATIDLLAAQGQITTTPSVDDVRDDTFIAEAHTD
ncbi:ABC transporter substrate-binding protein [Microbacterium trichothecenolyticum]|uniref:NitT/TauT family transport system substrate-binding protein n=1 Tax=Microbacterium trichothecenolyticum TaxID=69370 RepID=A0ABU0TXV1_MICTR|nr:ABC transporter substrate-binding protein [Microbacterium trichothecenolyticum]MDQ1124492.1 NitT/TauT family transport system substrate-binding protein [Microbacterium trichothecenolyticum]